MTHKFIKKSEFTTQDDLKNGLKCFQSSMDLLGLENLIFSKKKKGFKIQSVIIWGCCWKASIWWSSEGKRVNLFERRRNKMSSAKLMATLVICVFLLFISHYLTTWTWAVGGGMWVGHQHPKVLFDLISLHQYSALVWPMRSQRDNSFLLMGICVIVRLWLGQEKRDGEELYCFVRVWLILA